MSGYNPKAIGLGMSDRAIYLGEGVWWQLTERQKQNRQYAALPQRIRPYRSFAS